MRNTLKASALLIMFLFASTAVADEIDYLVNVLKPWGKMDISIDQNGGLMLHTSHDRITDTIYKAVIRYGVCDALRNNAKEWADISSVTVFNTYGRQGYVFEGGVAACKELGNLNASTIEPALLGKTRLY